NERIRAPLIRLIDNNGQQLGIMEPYRALGIARERELDLVEVAPTADPPVCRILDFGKYKYEISRREREARKKQHVMVLKGIRLSPMTDDHDFETKVRHAREFLQEGAKVKVTVVLRGRLMAHPEFAKQTLDRFAAALGDLAKAEAPAQMETPRQMGIVFGRK
ncbi:MAG: translation initiation factor IF-3, partial [Calditrichaeota bacterium]|nr:translation initiation factor IF-3 [Calditrichota bacterium]